MNEVDWTGRNTANDFINWTDVNLLLLFDTPNGQRMERNIHTRVGGWVEGIGNEMALWVYYIPKFGGHWLLHSLVLAVQARFWT